MNPFANTIATTNAMIGLPIGYVLLMPSIMAFDAAPNIKPSMVLLGCSGLSVIPVTIVASGLTIVTGDLVYQTLYAIPIIGISTASMIGTHIDNALNVFTKTI